MVCALLLVLCLWHVLVLLSAARALLPHCWSACVVCGWWGGRDAHGEAVTMGA